MFLNYVIWCTILLHGFAEGNGKGSTYLHGDKYFYFSAKTEEKNSTEAENYCNKIGGTLATIVDRDTDKFINSTLGHYNGRRVYIGGRRHFENGSRIWRWMNGSFLYNETRHKEWKSGERILDGKYVGWRVNHPGSYEDYNCLSIGGAEGQISSKYYWVTSHSCTSSTRFICEIPAIGAPTSVNVTSKECTPEVEVEWKPHPDSLNKNHRISITSVSDKTETKEKIAIPSSVKIYKKNFKNLSPSTEYSVEIKVCPESCNQQPVPKYKITTRSPAEVERVTLNQIQEKGSKVCVISWTLNAKKEQKVDRYKVKVSTKHFYSRTSTNRPSTEIYDAYTTAFNLSTQPNRNYTFRVVAIHCSQEGREVPASGECFAYPEAPSTIPRPQVSVETNKGNTIDVTIYLPDENNGPISCVFVIVKIGDDKRKEISFGNLRKAERAAKGEEIKEGSYYIARAMPRSLFKEVSMKAKIKIGTGKVSTCDTLGSLSEESEFEGHDLPLEIEKKHSLLIVTSTPTPHELLLKTGPLYEFTVIPPRGSVRLEHSNSINEVANFFNGENVTNFNCIITSYGFSKLTTPGFFIDGVERPLNFTVSYKHHNKYAYCNYSNKFTEYYGYYNLSNQIRLEVFHSPVKISVILRSCTCENTGLCNITLSLSFLSNPELGENNISVTTTGGDKFVAVGEGCNFTVGCAYYAENITKRQLGNLSLIARYDQNFDRLNKISKLQINDSVCTEQSEDYSSAQTTHKILLVGLISGIGVFLLAIFLLSCYMWKNKKEKKQGRKPSDVEERTIPLQERTEPRYENAPFGILEEESAYVDNISIRGSEPDYENAPFGNVEEENAYAVVI